MRVTVAGCAGPDASRSRRTPSRPPPGRRAGRAAGRRRPPRRRRAGCSRPVRRIRRTPRRAAPPPRLRPRGSAGRRDLAAPRRAGWRPSVPSAAYARHGAHPAQRRAGVRGRGRRVGELRQPAAGLRESGVDLGDSGLKLADGLLELGDACGDLAGIGRTARRHRTRGRLAARRDALQLALCRAQRGELLLGCGELVGQLARACA